jgi:hypothetical protein
MKVSTVAVASRRVTVGLRPCDLVVARLPWRLLDFLVSVAACGLLGVLVSMGTPTILVVVAVVVPSRVGSSHWGMTNLGDGACVTLRS